MSDKRVPTESERKVIAELRWNKERMQASDWMAVKLIVRYKDALLKYGVHSDTCESGINGPETCDCGFDEACWL